MWIKHKRWWTEEGGALSGIWTYLWTYLWIEFIIMCSNGSWVKAQNQGQLGLIHEYCITLMQADINQ